MKKKIGLLGILVMVALIITIIFAISKSKQPKLIQIAENKFKIVQVEDKSDKNLMAKTLAEGDMEFFITFEEDGKISYGIQLQETAEIDKKANEKLSTFRTLYQELLDEIKWSFGDNILEIQTGSSKAIFEVTTIGKNLELVLQEGKSPFGSGTLYLEKQ